MILPCRIPVVVWVVDYKTSRSELDRDNLQVQEYMEIVASIYPDCEVRGYLLYLDELKAEQVNG